MIEESKDESAEVEARFVQLKEQALEAVALLPHLSNEVADVIRSVDSPATLADMVANLIDEKVEEKQDLLETFDLVRRLDKVIALLASRVGVLKLTQQLREKTQATFDERQREHILREQLRQIQKELGEDDNTEAEVEELKKAIATAGMPEDVLKHAEKELKRLQRMSDSGTEYSMVRTYLEWLTELPWTAAPQHAIDMAEARRILDEDHFGLDKIKRRILEYLAVRKLNPQGKSPILCFVGPPGVGKTSLGQSIAKATGRAFQRVALGGVHDEAEIRGHRRTYVGALPGNIIQAMKRAESTHALLMLDEIDKLGGGGFHGDPSSGLLEVLDPEQNNKFRDNYLAVDFDLSRVMFICTANQLDTIPGPLRDRMEIIQLAGYTQEEKVQIARRYLVQRQLDANGLTAEQASITDAALASIVAEYTREAGVRNLEREIGAVFRRVAMRIAEEQVESVTVDANDIAEILGRNALRERSGAAHQHARRGNGSGMDAGGWRHPVHRSEQSAGQRQADPHRATRRRDEGVRAGGADAGEDLDGRCAGYSRYPRAHPGRGDAEGWAKCGRGDVPRAGVAAVGQADSPGRGYDRRDQPARAGVADWRLEGEDAGCVTRGYHYGDAATTQCPRPRRRACRSARQAELRVSGSCGGCG